MIEGNGYPKDHISVSQINLYLMCPLKYRFTYVDRLPRPFKSAALALGSAIHSALAWWHKQRLLGVDPGAQKVATVFAADFHAQREDNVLYRPGSTEMQLVDQGKAMLSVYTMEYSGGPPTAVEMPFRVPLVDSESGEILDLPLDGFVDLVEESDTVVELKTPARNYSLLDVSQHLQLTAYAYAYEQLYRRQPRLRLDCLVKTRKPQFVSWETERTKSDHIRFVQIAKAVLQGIKNRQFHPCPGWLCGDCEFYSPCQQWRCESNGSVTQPRITQRRVAI